MAVHCKAGKGRTGVVISCLLLYNELINKWEYGCKTATDSMRFYGARRTRNNKGVTCPS